MEQNKLENQFRKKLNSREIQPSAQSWDRLDAMLTVADQSNHKLANQNPKKKNTWFFIAASISGILLIGTFLFNQKDSQKIINNNAIVNQNTNATGVLNNKNNISNLGLKTQSIAIKDETKKEISNTKKEVNFINTKNKTNNEKLAENSIISQKNEQKTISEKPTNSIVDERVTFVERPSKNEILLNQKSTIKIDASSLLSQVDGELELSFREKVIKTVAKNYKEVKVAVNNRNNE